MRRAGDLLFSLGAAPGHGLAVRGECGEVETNNVARVGMISTGIDWRPERCQCLAGGEIPMLHAHPTISIVVVFKDPDRRNQRLTVGRTHKGGSVWCGISRDGDAGPLLGRGNVPHRELGRMPVLPFM